ncbi:PilX N-terminal domain-containing pilus assembly protein [Acinetobacter sp.]|mgnify:FL=1|uniref:pilus assembly PilX family protein n=1 Tax=Acinetobacter sp. TaxID=472 RepID=UPI00388D4D6D
MMNSRVQQKGSTLVVVLIMLVIITIIGVVGVRHSMTSLNIATNSQINELLRQSSDSAMLALEDVSDLEQLSTANGILGFISQPENLNKELVFCFKKNQGIAFTINQASMLEFTSTGIRNSTLGKRGFCKPKNSLFYTSERNAVLTQVAIRRSTAGVLEPAFSNYVTGTDFVSAKTQNNERFTIYATSVLPSVGGANKDDIENCLSNHFSGSIQSLSLNIDSPAATTVSQCLEKLGVPYITQVADYSYMVGFNKLPASN